MIAHQEDDDMSRLLKETIELDYFSDERLSSIGDLIRFCMSDIVVRSINCVVEGDLSPVDYAHLMIKKHYKLLYDAFFYIRLEESKIDKPHISSDDGYDIFASYMFDKLVIAGCLFRSSRLDNYSVESISDTTHFHNGTFVSMLIHLLTMKDKRYDYSYLSGLTDFKTIGHLFVGSVSSNYPNLPIGILNRLSNNIGDIGDDHWILLDRVWGKFILDDTKTALSFRRFLNMSLMSLVLEDSLYLSSFGTDKEKVFKDIDFFLDLREDKETTLEDIRYFFNKISYYTETFAENEIFESLAEKQYSDFKDIYIRSRNKLNDDEHNTDTKNPIDVLIADMTSTLGSAYDQSVIDSDSTAPLEYTNHIFNEYRDGILENVVEPHYRRIGLPNTEYDKDSILIDGSIKDYLMMVMVYQRYKFHNHPTPFSEIKRTCHILLVAEYEELGFSVLTWILPFHFTNCSKYMSESQGIVCERFLEALEKISISFPSMMNPHWKDILEDLEIMTNLRAWIFTIIEGLYALSVPDDEIYKSIVSTNKTNLFKHIDELTNLIQQECTQAQLLEYLASVPNIQKTMSLNETAYKMWLEQVVTEDENNEP